jgi:hypothetical protein
MITTAGWSSRALCALQSVGFPLWDRGGAARRVNFDNPPLKGSCRAL